MTPPSEPRLAQLKHRFRTAQWLPAAGNSMWPLIRSGDWVFVEPIAYALRRGSVALVSVDEQLIAHIVLRTNPLQTCSLLGVADRPAQAILARVSRVRRGSREFRVGRLFRLAAMLAPRVAPQARRVAWIRTLWRRLRDGKQ
jgi:Peptidase S24-like